MIASYFNTQLTSLDADEWSEPWSDCVMLLNPLHVALVADRRDFIAKVFDQCPHYCIDVNYLHYARVVGNESAGLSLLAQANVFTSPPKFSSLAYFSPTLASTFDAADQPISMFWRANKSTRMTEIQTMLESIEKANAFENDSSQRERNLILENRSATVEPQLHGQLQGLFVAASQKSSPLSLHPQAYKSPFFRLHLALMEGGVASIEDLIGDIHLLNRTLPIPLTACGENGTGTTLLHRALIDGVPSIETGHSLRSQIAQHLHALGCKRGFAVNKDGLTPLFLSIRCGDLVTTCALLEQSNLVVATRPFAFATDHYGHDVNTPTIYKALLKSDTSLSTELRVKTRIYERARSRLAKAEQEWEEISQQKNFVPSFTANIGTLTTMISRTERIWTYVCEGDFMRLIQLSYTACGVVLDSIMRAKQILTAIGVPFSQIGSSGSTECEVSHPARSNAKSFSKLDAASLRSLLTMNTCLHIKGINYPTHL